MAEITTHDVPPRTDSPSPSISPTVASSNCPQLDRSVSAASSITSSCVSTPLDQSLADNASKRRGYMRPQATVFANSARNRDSVMSLGTIAHLQYYFARTGLLDGKGGQLAKERKSGEPTPTQSRSVSGTSVNPQSPSFLDPQNSQFDFGGTSPFSASPEMSSHSSDPLEEPQVLALPPTYSTYKKKAIYIPSPPNLSVLRRELRETLEDAKKVLLAQESVAGRSQSIGGTQDGQSTDDAAPTQGWHEIEGLHVLDLVTLAIKAAKNYYTSHDQPQRLYTICSERRIRAELFNVLETLKRVGSRNFAGGYRRKEIEEILTWIANIEDLVEKDEKAEKAEQERRESWMWLNGTCNGLEREREWVFLKSFEPKGTNLPPWSELPEDGQPGPFLEMLRDGVKLVQLHNELVKNSWRQFGEIKSWHTDTVKPYRCMENLRYWIKAAQLRWDTVLELDVSGVVNDKGPEPWKTFDAAILKWCRAVREELTTEWKEHNQPVEGPLLQVEPARSEYPSEIEESSILSTSDFIPVAPAASAQQPVQDPIPAKLEEAASDHAAEPVSISTREAEAASPSVDEALESLARSTSTSLADTKRDSASAEQIPYLVGTSQATTESHAGTAVTPIIVEQHAAAEGEESQSQETIRTSNPTAAIAMAV